MDAALRSKRSFRRVGRFLSCSRMRSMDFYGSIGIGSDGRRVASVTSPQVRRGSILRKFCGRTSVVCAPGRSAGRSRERARGTILPACSSGSCGRNQLQARAAPLSACCAPSVRARKRSAGFMVYSSSRRDQDRHAAAILSANYCVWAASCPSFLPSLTACAYSVAQIRRGRYVSVLRPDARSSGRYTHHLRNA